jgi:hypothetical protein
MDGDEKFVKLVAISKLMDLEHMTTHVGIKIGSDINLTLPNAVGRLKIE